MRILVIEDEWLIASQIERTLREAGIEIAGTASSVGRALRLVETTAADGAVLDANLRGAASEPVAAELIRKRLPFLVISGYSGHETKGLLADRPFLRKPFALPDLVAQVRRLVP